LREHFQSVWCTARRLGLLPMRADEATQEAFVVFSSKLDQVTPGSERRYLTSVVVRLASNYRRVRSAEAELSDEDAVSDYPDPGPLPDELLERKRLRGVLDHALSRMPMPLRGVFVLYELEGLNAPEIADLLGVPQGTIVSRLRKAREVFAAALRRARARASHAEGKP
jgi:RNA polymerase sigma-70 factor (ECF subfamily)